MKVKGLISLVEDSDIKYRRASYRDIKRIISSESLEDLDRIINDIRNK